MTTPERIRADTLALMAAHADLTPRGWNRQRERAILHRKIDELLDRYALESMLWSESIPRTLEP